MIIHSAATPGLWSLLNLLSRKVTPRANRTSRRPVQLTSHISASFPAYWDKIYIKRITR